MNTQPNELHHERIDDEDRKAISRMVGDDTNRTEAVLLERIARNKPASGPGIGDEPKIELRGNLPGGSWDYTEGWSPYHGAMRCDFTLWEREATPGDGSGSIALQVSGPDHEAALRACGGACPEFAAAWAEHSAAVEEVAS